MNRFDSHLLVNELRSQVEQDLVVSEVGMSWQDQEDTTAATTTTLDRVNSHRYSAFVDQVELSKLVSLLDYIRSGQVNATRETNDEVRHEFVACFKIIIFEHVRKVSNEGPKEFLHQLVSSLWLELSEELVCGIDLREIQKEGGFNVVFDRVVEWLREVFAA